MEKQKYSISKLFNKSFSWLNLTQIVSIVIALLTFLAMFNRFHLFLELMSHFRFQYFILAIVCSLIFLLYRSPQFFAVMLVITLINGSYVSSWYFDPSDIPLDNQSELKVMLSNVNNQNQNYQEVVELVLQESPDLFFAQEVNRNWMSKLSVLEGDYPYQLADARQDSFGIAVFSKYPLQNTQQPKWGILKLPSLQFDISVAGKNITIITTHPPPPIGNQLYRSRNSQLGDIAEVSSKIQQPLIIIGDLNITMWSHYYQQLENKGNLKNARQSFGIKPTWPAVIAPIPIKIPKIMMIPIDHCLVSKEIKVGNFKTAKAISSDHLPIVVDLAL